MTQALPIPDSPAERIALALRLGRRMRFLRQHRPRTDDTMTSTTKDSAREPAEHGDGHEHTGER